MSIFEKLFKKEKKFSYDSSRFLIEFKEDNIKNKENEEPTYVKYVNAKDISPDLKVRGTKYYKGNTIGTDIKFVIYLRVRYDKIGREYIMEPLITQLKAIDENARTVDVSNSDICDINLNDLLNGHLDCILDDIVKDDDGKTSYRTYISFKHFTDKNGRDVEGYLSFDNSEVDKDYMDYIKKFAISSSLK